jgi:hypothetical protein
MVAATEPRTLGGLEMQLYTDRPDMWGILKAMELAPGYKPEIWALLSESDKAIIRAYSNRVKAVKAQIATAKR